MDESRQLAVTEGQELTLRKFEYTVDEKQKD